MKHEASLALAAALLLVVLTAWPGRPGAQPAQDPGRQDDWTTCRQAIAAAEPASGIPVGVLGAIALVESGGRDPRTGRAEPWPWSYNAEGAGRAAPSKAAAINEVSALLRRGMRSIDVGCMQVNLLHHPNAFASLDQAFDPQANLAYAIRFLLQLHARTGDWEQAIARYHSAEPERGGAYSRKVALARSEPGGTRSLPAPQMPTLTPTPTRTANVLRGVLTAGLDRAEAQRLERHLMAENDLGSIRLLSAVNPAAAVQALSDSRQYRGLTQEQRAAMASLAAQRLELEQIRMRARSGLMRAEGGAGFRTLSSARNVALVASPMAGAR
ncbi:transglycosylase SLT domain-containing protein [Roseomonas populi]|uniref:Transglycosylase SLT domain-containing protein n=1 Tax=Roseomonas populi TaxID=3121582 RepID=A0ABT1X6B3_9PROT|nr:transglycosylase SLT domain-containing protein [Roseomonas pecuniae]MCR0983646.1 transglycosylase SLT domain-containing protein [Roseomonas pecuniae]